MKLKFLMATILISNCATAQLSLEHTYDKVYSFQTVNLEDEGTKYVIVDTATKHVVFYNEDHSYWKRIFTVIPNGNRFAGVSCVSKRLIDVDDDIELAFTFITTSGPSLYTTQVYKEDRTIIQTLDNVASCYPVKVNGHWKVVAYKPNYSYDVYSVPGEYLGIKDPGAGSGTTGSATLYPNPLDAAATLKYKLPTGVDMATLSVYDMSGKMVRTYIVTDQFQDVIIARDILPSGVYTYTLTTKNQPITTAQFVIR